MKKFLFVIMIVIISMFVIVGCSSKDKESTESENVEKEVASESLSDEEAAIKALNDFYVDYVSSTEATATDNGQKEAINEENKDIIAEIILTSDQLDGSETYLKNGEKYVITNNVENYQVKVGPDYYEYVSGGNNYIIEIEK